MIQESKKMVLQGLKDRWIYAVLPALLPSCFMLIVQV